MRAPGDSQIKPQIGQIELNASSHKKMESSPVSILEFSKKNLHKKNLLVESEIIEAARKFYELFK